MRLNLRAKLPQVLLRLTSLLHASMRPNGRVEQSRQQHQHTLSVNYPKWNIPFGSRNKAAKARKKKRIPGIAHTVYIAAPSASRDGRESKTETSTTDAIYERHGQHVRPIRHERGRDIQPDTQQRHLLIDGYTPPSPSDWATKKRERERVRHSSHALQCPRKSSRSCPTT